jgi:hypothetical protein
LYKRDPLFIAEAVSEYLVEPNRSRVLDEILAYETVEQANEELRRLTGIRCFFSDNHAFDEFQRALSLPALDTNGHRGREWGDFQTPPELASRVCHLLAQNGVSPRFIIEPTYGTGNFILAALNSFPKAELVYGVEIQEKYEWHLKIALLTQAMRSYHPSAEIELHHDDIFTHSFPDDILRASDILIIGNPPWVTSAELGALNASNLPTKRNLKGLNGLDAVTGKSNFDIGEFILLRILELFSRQPGTLAMLCKNSVIKNIVEVLPRTAQMLKVANIQAYAIDAKREFGAAVDASLLVMKMGVSASTFSCRVATLDHPDRVIRVFGWMGDRFVSDIGGYEQTSQLDGQSPFVWRQGLKHDCAKIMELNVLNGTLINGNDEIVDIEEQWVYWLLKGSDLRKFEVDRARKKVIVTQHHIGEDTSRIRTNAPKLWQYLMHNRKYLERRKSGIYRDRSPFSIFGIGEYSFKTYKVAISGLHKRPQFSLVPPIDNQPVMLDDTCYFLGFDTYLEGLFTTTLLNNAIVKQFLEAVVFADAKRPYTKEVLMRIDLESVAQQLSFDEMRTFWSDIGYEPKVSVTEADFETYRQCLSAISKKDEILQLSLGI